ncbi:hypothetical protein Acsp02_13490 [Actinoplanes sp. NBRC 103695]|nr:hypothetical protein Acsp02_13490 [Actinoplanes sp. NBRC 103695]
MVTLSCLFLVYQLVDIGGAGWSNAWQTVTGATIVLIATMLVTTSVRGRPPRWEPLVTPPLVLVSGIAMVPSFDLITLASGIAAVQSFYGSTRSWTIRTIGCVIAIPTAVAISPYSADRMTAWNSWAVLADMPQMLLVAVVLRGIYVAIRSQERAGARAMILARTGSLLLSAPDVETVHQIGNQAAGEILALNPGFAMIILRRQPGADGLTVALVTGLPEDVVGRVVPDALPAGPGPLFADVAPQFQHWRIDDLAVDSRLLVGGVKPVPDHVFDVLRSLCNQVLLGETGRRSHADLDHRANHDHLTGLPVRALFTQHLFKAVETRPPGTVALLNIDLDDFKKVNDTYGHSAGDELLVEVAFRLREAAGPAGVASRFGGDEFALLLTSLNDPTEAETIAKALCDRLVQPLRLADVTVRVGASIGVAVTEYAVTATELTRRADIAMYSAKARGKNRVRLFTPGEHGNVARHRMLEDQLPHAIDRDEIIVRYQPYRDLDTGACTGVEALAEWAHPVLGTIGWQELSDVAERTGDLAGVSGYVLRKVCAELAELPAGDGLRIGINVAAHSLLPGFADGMLAAVAAGGLSLDRVTLEIVEAEQIDDPAAHEQLRVLAGHGVWIALDDFGTGYVSFASLRSFPIHQLKIDSSFLTGSEDALDLVLSMGEVLDTHTVVQGVTEAEYLARLRRTTASAAQGDLLASPMTAGELAAWLVALPPLPGPALRHA